MVEAHKGFVYLPLSLRYVRQADRVPVGMNFLQKWAVRVLSLEEIYSGWLRDGAEDDLSDAGPDWQDEYRRAMRHPERSAIVSNCVGFLRKNTRRTPLLLERRAGMDDWRPADHLVLAKLRKIVGPAMRSMALWGNAYYRMPLNNAGRPMDFKYLHPGNLEQLKGDDGKQTAWQYTHGSGKIETIPLDEVLHLRWDGDDTWPRSPTPLLAVVRYVNLDAAATIFVKVGIDNGPGGLLVTLKDVAAKVGWGKQQQRDLVKRLEQGWTKLRRGRPLVPGLPVEFEEFKPTVENLKFLHDLCEERICAEYSLPPAIIGLGTGLEHADTRAAHETMLRQAWEFGLIPVQDELSMQLTEKVLPLFRLDSRYRLRFDRSQIEVLQKDLMKLTQRLRIAWTSGMAKRKEVRELLGWEVDEVADDIYYPELQASLRPDPIPMLPAGDGERLALPAGVERRALSDAQIGILSALEKARRRAERTMSGLLRDAFKEFGELLADAYLEAWEAVHGEALRSPEDDPDKIERIVARVMSGWTGWAGSWETVRFREAWEEGLQYTTLWTRTGLDAQLDVSLGGPDKALRKVLEEGGARRGLVDLQGETRRKLFRVLSEEPTVSKHPFDAAKDIARQVPSGPWSTPEVRGRVIARTETHFAQNVAALETYDEAAFTHVEAVDNQVGHDDADCKARDGQRYTIEEAKAIVDHPAGTLNWVPVVEELS